MSCDRPRTRRLRSPHAALTAQGEPWIWLTAGALALALAMITGLLGFIVVQGSRTFWPAALVEVRLADGTVLLGDVVARERDAAGTTRLLVHGADSGLGSLPFRWVDEGSVTATARPTHATAVEVLDGGRVHGIPLRLRRGAEVVAEGAEAAWERFVGEHPAVRARARAIRCVDRDERGALRQRLRAARLDAVAARLASGPDSAAARVAGAAEVALAARTADEERRLDLLTADLRQRDAGWALDIALPDGRTMPVALDEIVRAWQPNRLSWWGKLRVYAGRWGDFLTDDPRAGGSAGGVFPAIWGTLALTVIMALFVAPLGVLAALYLSEYAGHGRLTTAVRIAINNLAGVPSIVYGAFGLGFFCHLLGGGIDALFFRAALVADGQPTFGTGGLLWAALTLAILTLPVVIVATEEALAAVPMSTREGSYACGAGKWQTIRRIVLPRALPGIMTGLILAMARGAGEVAPLILVGVKKVAVDLPIDRTFPFIHPQREFMHLASLIHDVGFQSPDPEAARPLVFTIALLLVALIALLNLAAIWLRSRLQRRYPVQQF